MAQPSAELLLACANQVGESPVWNAGRGVLHWLDIPQGQVHTLHLATGTYSVWQRDGAIGCIAMSDDGGLVAGGAEGFVALTPDGDGFAESSLAPVLSDRPDLRLNDGACDRQGRFWSGSMRLAADPDNPGGLLYRLDKGLATPMLDGFVTQNGLAWSPDGKTMYVSDSHPSRAGVWAFDYDTETGTPSNRRLFVDFAGTGSRPDGAAMDAEGGYWIAATDAAKLLRFTPDGQCDAEILVPTAHPTKPCFGGPDLRSLFVTSLRPAKPDAQAGNLFACLTPWQGIAETPYRPVP